ncbi:hypothetical protein H2241_16015 [Pantoea ananatis]|uniref:hypothetical protein n=1 Tax=Pantoea ananas TaxID=553 RepID=UPI00158CE8A3|nr:hypothetical protein [Pantoea ananatis]MBA4822456.1 hypothetical protein [Pantoea ananatis]QKV87640.1 hypothetical protein FOB88_11110 [Pantoea ananatis]
MRQLTTSEASNDEMERQRFEDWATEGMSELHKMIFTERFGMQIGGNYKNSKSRLQWEAWQAALKNKRE